MSDKYLPANSDGIYFLTMTTVVWVDVFTRREYKQLVVDSLRYCQQHKGLELFAWYFMPSHLMARDTQGQQSYSGLTTGTVSANGPDVIKDCSLAGNGPML